MMMLGMVGQLRPEFVIKCLLMGYGSIRIVTDLYKIWSQWWWKRGRDDAKKKAKDWNDEDDDSDAEEAAALLAKRKPPELWNTAIFFPDTKVETPGSPTDQLIQLINGARISIQICMYLSSYVPIEEAILKKYSKGLIIQVVTCFDTMTAHNNHFKKWRDNLKIPVRMKNTRYLMHNKFLIIDDEAVITGSLNWTTQGIIGNQENVIVSTNPSHVARYREKFAELWVSYAED
jgi:phosphatidylserine/phosphatidylglycerophosphate/cardiolipin synthase-like enzyme